MVAADKMDKRKSSKNNGGAAPPAKITDKRFASFETDPRFRLPSRKQAKTTIDKRFAGMLKDKEFTATALVDKYGRKIKSDAKKKALERLYELEDEEKEDEEEEEEDNDEKDDDEKDEDGEDEDGAAIELDDDEVVQRELRAAHEQFKKHDPAREGGFSSSDDDSDSDSDQDSDDDAEPAAGDDMQRLEREEIETGEVTTRIAIVNLDWDHVKSVDLMALFSSFIPASDGGKVLSIAVYPSEFGKERMQQEELEGPPKDLFKKGKKDDDSDDESDSDSEAEEAKIKKKLLQEGDDQDFDGDALRAYQLDRLRYYYAVMTCSSKSTAQAIYETTDGTEYQASSNFIDLRFVPDDVTFDDEPRDQCDKMPESYKPIEFVTNALQSSKVKLTWDMHPEETSRKESIKRAFKGSRAEINEEDLRAYLAGDSDSDEEEDEGAGEEDGAVDADEPKLTKKELARKRMREALGLADEPARKSKDGPVGEMEVTFTPALTDNSKSKKKEQEETTIEKYARKEKERKEQKRQASKAKREAVEQTEVAAQDASGDDSGEDLGFNDPFFTTEDPAPATKTSVRKEERRKKREAREAAEAQDAEEKARLVKVMAEDADENQADHLDHFDMNEIMRVEKQKGKKKKHQKKGKAAETRGGLQEGFEMDVDDERFKAVFESHEFAIDPSNPRFKATEGMKKLLEEGRKKRKMVAGDEEERSSGKSKKAKKGRR